MPAGEGGDWFVIKRIFNPSFLPFYMHRTSPFCGWRVDTTLDRNQTGAEFELSVANAINL